MAKTKEELIQLKDECATLNNKLKELSDSELNYVTGGASFRVDENGNYVLLSQEESCIPLEGIKGDGSNITFFCCTDKLKQGKKPECASCPAKNSKNYC